eukprot:3357595-Amphidinium_carterae.1
MATVHAKLQELRKDLATVHVDQEASGGGTSNAKEGCSRNLRTCHSRMLKCVKGKALGGTRVPPLSYRTDSLCGGARGHLDSCDSTHSGDEMDLDEEMDNKPELQVKRRSLPCPSKRHLLGRLLPTGVVGTHEVPSSL